MATSDAGSRYGAGGGGGGGDDGYGGGGDPAPSIRSGRSMTLRRGSMEEDAFYRQVMTALPSQPPSYDSALKAALAAQRRALAYDKGLSCENMEDVLPEYSCDVHIEGIFMRKMEIEDTIRRAELRSWQMVYVVLHGTALNIYHVKKERGWWLGNHDEGPNIQPDNPPWIKKGKLEKSYSLLHADAGIAADYKKRRYVIRMRAETDQFLLSCVELETFVTWLDRIFASISIAAPIDNRDFPADQSIPRVQRQRYLRGQRPLPQENIMGYPRVERRPSDTSSAIARRAGLLGTLVDEDEDEPGVFDGPDEPIQETDENPAAGPTVMGQHVQGRLSTTSYPNESVDPITGKWLPKHNWTSTHDLLYAKICFAVLLFKSPRKSNYIINNGKQWFVDWKTGRMARVLPPAYGESAGEIELVGPWQFAGAEINRRL